MDDQAATIQQGGVCPARYRDLRPDCLPKPPGWQRREIAAIDIETGAYELGDDMIQASDRLFARCPDAQIWFVRVGYPAVHRIGWQARTTKP